MASIGCSDSTGQFGVNISPASFLKIKRYIVPRRFERNPSSGKIYFVIFTIPADEIFTPNGHVQANKFEADSKTVQNIEQIKNIGPLFVSSLKFQNNEINVKRSESLKEKSTCISSFDILMYSLKVTKKAKYLKVRMFQLFYRRRWRFLHQALPTMPFQMM